MYLWREQEQTQSPPPAHDTATTHSSDLVIHPCKKCNSDTPLYPYCVKCAIAPHIAGVCITKSKLHGLGVFFMFRRPIGHRWPADLHYNGDRVDAVTLTRLHPGDTVAPYAIKHDNGTLYDASTNRSWLSMLNSSSNPNCKLIVDEHTQHIIITAIREISPGQEITVSYPVSTVQHTTEDLEQWFKTIPHNSAATPRVPRYTVYNVVPPPPTPHRRAVVRSPSLVMLAKRQKPEQQTHSRGSRSVTADGGGTRVDLLEEGIIQSNSCKMETPDVMCVSCANPDGRRRCEHRNRRILNAHVADRLRQTSFVVVATAAASLP